MPTAHHLSMKFLSRTSILLGFLSAVADKEERHQKFSVVPEQEDRSIL